MRFPLPEAQKMESRTAAKKRERAGERESPEERSARGARRGSARAARRRRGRSDGEGWGKGGLLQGSGARSGGKRGAHTHARPRGRRGNPGPTCLRRGCPRRRGEEDPKYGWRSKRERQPVRKVQISHLTAIGALLPHTSPETFLILV